MVDGYNIGAQNQHADSGAYEFHIHGAYIIYGTTCHYRQEALNESIGACSNDLALCIYTQN